MTVGVAAERPGIGPRERIGTMALVRGALRRLAANWRGMLLLGLATASLELTIALGAEAVGVAATRPSLEPAYIARILLTTLIGGLGAALSYRLMLQGWGDWRRLDRPLLECAGLIALGALVTNTGGTVAARLAMTSMEGGAGMAVAGYASMLTSGVMFYLGAKLLLWPIGRLMGRPELGPGRSWRLMRRATRGYVLAHVLAILPFTLATTVWMANVVLSGASPAEAAGQGWFTRGVAFAMQGFTIFSLAISATIYALRVEAPATMADVFD